MERVKTFYSREINDLSGIIMKTLRLVEKDFQCG